MVAVYDVLRGNTFFAGFQGDGHAVLVGASDENDVAAFKPLVAGIDVGGYIHAGQVSDVYRTVGVRQSSGYEYSFEILFHWQLVSYVRKGC